MLAGLELDPVFIKIARLEYLLAKQDPRFKPNKFSPRKFQPAQLESLRRMLTLSKFFHYESELGDHEHSERLGIAAFAPAFLRVGLLDHRAIVKLLEQSDEFRRALDLSQVPHFSTLAKFEARMSRLTDP